MCVCVSQVYDQYLNFITLEDDMFVLCHQNKELISYHGNFNSSVSCHLLYSTATGVSHLCVCVRVCVCACVCACVCVSPAAINRADIQDTDMEAIMDTIVDSLFCFFVTLGQFSASSHRFWLFLSKSKQIEMYVIGKTKEKSSVLWSVWMMKQRLD